MKNAWKNICVAMGVVVSSSASADDNMSTSTETMKKPCLTIPSSAAPRIDNDFNLTVSGAGLWWKSSQVGREYAQSTHTGSIQSTVHTIPYKWNYGYKVGVGYELPRDNWDLEANWIHFYNNGSESLSGVGLIQPLDSNLSDMAGYSSSSARMRTKINVVDLTMGRDFYVGRYTTLYPFAGLRGQWIMQKEKFAFVRTDGTAGDSATIHNRHAGLGPIAGFGMDWRFGWGFSLCGDLAASLVYGYVNVKADYFNSANATFLDFGNDKNDHGAIIPDGDFSIGLKWDYNFDKSAYLAFALSWEQHFFLDQWRWHNATDSVANPFSGGNTLATQGLTLSARLEF